MRIRAVRRIPVKRSAFVMGTLALAAAVRCALWTVPFRWIRRVVESRGPIPMLRGRITARQVAWAVRLACCYIPRATCLTQALTAQILLNWAGIDNRLHIGVAKGATFESHAWIECEQRVLVGGAEESARYATILILQRPAGRV